MRSHVRVIALLIALEVFSSSCGDQSQNCAEPCSWNVRVHNGTSDVVYFVVRTEPRKTTLVKPDETANVTYLMPKYGDLTTKSLQFLALDANDKPVFCRRIAWSTLETDSLVEIRPGQIEC